MPTKANIPPGKNVLSNCNFDIKTAINTTAVDIVNGTGNKLPDYNAVQTTSKQCVPFVLYPDGQNPKQAPFNKLYPETQLKQISLSKHL